MTAAAHPLAAPPLLEVEGLRTEIETGGGVITPVDGVGFSLAEGEAMGLVGESGSGKSMTCLSVMGLPPRPAGRVVDGEVRLHGDDLRVASPREMRAVRGGRIAMILQDPMLSLNPVKTIGSQVAEAIRLEWPRLPRSEVRERVVAALERVHIPRPGDRLSAYPFEFSGGMRQRVTAAIAISRNPEVLIADEPTTALDVTTQDQFLHLLRELRSETGMGLVLVTHDLGVVAEVCDSVAVMYAGRIVERGPTERVFAQPSHPYTKALLEAIPRLEGERLGRLPQIDGEPPDLAALPAGCRFADRCPSAHDRCRDYPPEVPVAGGGSAACWMEVAT